MRLRWAAWAVVVAFVLVLAACSTPVSIDDYADAMSAGAAAYVEEAQTLSLRYQGGVEDGVRELVESSETPQDDAVALVRGETIQFLVLLEDAMTRYLEELDGTVPPSAVEEEHGAYVAAVASVVEAMPATRDGISAAESLDAVGFALNSSGFADGQARWTASCKGLEQAVRDEGRGMDLKCEIAETGGAVQP